MIICVGSTDAGRILSSLSSCSHVVRASANRSCGGKPRECLEIKPQLADIIRDFTDGVSTRSCGWRGVGAGVVWISDVGGVGLDAGAAGGGGDHTWVSILLQSSNSDKMISYYKVKWETYSTPQSQQHSFRQSCPPWRCTRSWCSMFHMWS